MTPDKSGKKISLSRKRRILFILAAIFFSLIIAIIACEVALQQWRRYIQNSDHMDPGMIHYDKHLGWRLSANWKGRHIHHDFDVAYSINRHGFRGNFRAKRKHGMKLHAFVGDSFTFGLGVDDDETFVYLLNLQPEQSRIFLNFSIPGFSTDQEALLIEKRVFDFSPDGIFLVVYLMNDLLDNELPYPLQARNAKPFFELTRKGLKLRNIPIPLLTKPEGRVATDLRQAVLGNDMLVEGFVSRQLNHFATFRVLKDALCKPPDLTRRFDIRFENTLRLFSAIINRIERKCREESVKLHLVLMPGRSLIERPKSISAQFQEYFRKKIVEDSKKKGISIIDIASQMQKRHPEQKGRWFHPHEGHLTAEGHRIVADMLEPLL